MKKSDRQGSTKRSDRQGSDSIDPLEKKYGAEAISRVSDLFSRFDLDGDGLISHEELFTVFERIDPDHWTPKKVKSLMDAIDTDHNGVIKYEELITWIMGKDKGMQEAKEAMQLSKTNAKRTSVKSMVFVNREVVETVDMIKVQLDLTDGSSCGVTLNPKCVIKAISSKGALALWNKDNSGTQVCVGHRIVKVHTTMYDSKRKTNNVMENEVTEDAHAMINEMKKKALLELTIQPKSNLKYTKKLADTFEVLSAIDEGRFAVVKKAQHVKTKRVYAVKSIFKDKMPQKGYESEYQAMTGVDHKNIVHLYEVFEDFNCVHLVLDLCEGGQILHTVFENSQLAEAKAARVAQQVLAAVCYLHSHKVCHRDVRPENILLEAPSEIEVCDIKLIDFGCARPYEKGQLMYSMIGRCEYTAREVFLRRGYTHLCDVWSCGILLYFLLSGYPPFVGENDYETVQAIQSSDLSFFEEDWEGVSANAKALITKMLARESNRPTAETAIQDTWLKDSVPKAMAKSLKGTTTSLKEFGNNARLKKIALHAVARNFSLEEMDQLKKDFELMDNNGDGRVTFHEFVTALQKSGDDGDAAEWRRIYESVDLDGNSRINYTEFLAAAAHRKSSVEEDLCWTAFNVFDRDGNGLISTAEFKNVLDSMCKDGSMDKDMMVKCLAEIDSDHNGQVDFHEFKAMMQGSTDAGLMVTL